MITLAAARLAALWFVVLLLFVTWLALVASCAQTPRARAGSCSPPLVHDGFALEACGVDVSDDSHVWCAYVGRLHGRQCRAVVVTSGCRRWVLADDSSGCDPEGETL